MLGSCGELHTTEIRMSRWARGKTRRDHWRNVNIWKEAHVYPIAKFLRIIFLLVAVGTLHVCRVSSETTGLDGLDMCKGGIKMMPREKYYR